MQRRRQYHTDTDDPLVGMQMNKTMASRKILANGMP